MRVGGYIYVNILVLYGHRSFCVTGVKGYQGVSGGAHLTTPEDPGGTKVRDLRI